MPKKKSESNPPPIIPPLFLEKTDEKIIVDGKQFTVLKLKRDVGFKHHAVPRYKI